MIMRIRVAAATAAFSAAMLLSCGVANATVCKGHSHTASASGAYETFTSLKARAAWRADVRAHEGTAWTFWQYARFKTTKCAKAGVKGSWTCVARARPCRPGN